MKDTFQCCPILIQSIEKQIDKDIFEQIRIEDNQSGVRPGITAKISKMRPRIRIIEVDIPRKGSTCEEVKKPLGKMVFRPFMQLLNTIFFGTFLLKFSMQMFDANIFKNIQVERNSLTLLFRYPF